VLATEYPRLSVLLMAGLVAGLGLLLLRFHRPLSRAMAAATEPMLPRRAVPVMAAVFRAALLFAACAWLAMAIFTFVVGLIGPFWRE
jgi:hypothetical protein